jgi:hypothetical protein
MTSLELAQEFTQLWESLENDEINTMLAKNVNFDLLEFFVAYSDRYLSDVDGHEKLSEEMQQQIPNLLVIGYLIRLLEERVS